MKTKTLKCILCSLFFTIYILPAMADPNDPDAENDPSAPIDDYIIGLFIIAILLGVNYLIQSKKKLIKN